MINVSGTSKVSINFNALSQLLQDICPEGNIPDLEIKMDARGNVKSTFMKIDNGKCSIYTGAIETEWDIQFTSSDNVTSSQDALLFIAVLALKKALAGVQYDMKLSNMANIRVEEDFISVRNIITQIVEKYTQISATMPEAVAQPKVSKTSSKAQSNPNAGQPLVDTPKVDIPEDLDLLDGDSVPDVQENLPDTPSDEDAPLI